MKKQQLSRLLNKYLEGKCTPDEELLLEEYLESLNNKKAGRNGKEFSSEQLAGEETYSKIMQIISNMDMEKSGLRKIVTSGYLLKIAASFITILVLSISVLYISGVFSTNSNQIVWKERITTSGEKSIINFSDGTKIILNGNSKLKYTDKGLNNKREVFLEGEAYFEVTHDSSKQFIVHSGNITTTDLGTKFDISAYSNEKEISVSLINGRINVSENVSGKNSDAPMLRPMQQLVYSTIRKTYNLRDFDKEEIIGWKDNILKFKDATFKEVLIKLERVYGIKFELKTKSYENISITANFEKASPETISRLIKKLTGLESKEIRENNQIKKIIFFQK